ncbi:NmrA family NAD(P)-binding protein [Ulvibacterium sp.]|uniref:NmrA family NAD(P)-binding protein n=1 Tax=Ulvibacterium sp. TaxID=2665914 RepID=UPI003BA9F389
MNIILGATGQVGSAIVEHLIEKGLPVKAVIRNEEKADWLKGKGAEVIIADYFDLGALKSALKDGKLLFVLTPEDVTSNDVLGETKELLDNYHKAVKESGIRSLIGLSSIGAQFESGTGNLLMSNMLEKRFIDLDINKVFVRPAYYYSNWAMSLDMVKENGMLPSFYPTDMKFNMISPNDVAKFIAEKIRKGVDRSETIEIVGPNEYSANDIAESMGKAIGQEVNTFEIPKSDWGKTMKSIGFSDNATKNFVEMTDLVAKGKAEPEGKGENPIYLNTTFDRYLNDYLNGL